VAASIRFGDVRLDEGALSGEPCYGGLVGDTIPIGGEHGSRHDWIVVFAFGCYYNLPYLETWLESTLLAGYDANILRDSAYIRLSSVYVIAKIYVCAVRYDKIDNPLRALTNLKTVGLSAAEYPAAINRVVEIARCIIGCFEEDAGEYEIWNRLVDVLYNDEFRAFKDVEGLPAGAYQALEAWEKAETERTMLSIDGKTKIPALALQRSVLYATPLREDWHLMLEHVLAHTKAWAESTLTSLERNDAQNLEPNGALCQSKQTPTMTAVLRGLETTNDNSERPFGTAKHLKAKSPTAGLQSLLGRAMARQMKLLKPPPQPRKQKAKNDAVRDAPRRLLDVADLPGGAETLRAIVVCATTNAKQGSTRDEMIAAGAGGALAKHDNKAALEAHSANLCESHKVKEADKKRRHNATLLAAAKVLAENRYTANPDALILGAKNDTAAVDLLVCQLRVVAARGWVKELRGASPTLDLTLGQTATKSNGSAAKKELLLTTLRAVAVLVQSLNLDGGPAAVASARPRVRALAMVSNLPKEATARRATFVRELSAAAIAEATEAAVLAAAQADARAAAAAAAAAMAAAAKQAKQNAAAAAKADKAAAKAVKDPSARPTKAAKTTTKQRAAPADLPPSKRPAAQGATRGSSRTARGTKRPRDE
jgi:hypothetical protein